MRVCSKEYALTINLFCCYINNIAHNNQGVLILVKICLAYCFLNLSSSDNGLNCESVRTQNGRSIAAITLIFREKLSTTCVKSFSNREQFRFLASGIVRMQTGRMKSDELPNPWIRSDLHGWSTAR